MNGINRIRLAALLGLVALIAAGCSTPALPAVEASTPVDKMADTGMSDGDEMADESHDDMGNPETMDDTSMSGEEDMSGDADMPSEDSHDDMGGSEEEMMGEDDAASESAANPDRPSAPVPINGDYRYDPPTVVAATGNPQFLEFFTGWCPTCKTMKPTVHGLEAEYWGTLDFVYLDREAPANSELVATYGISSQPIFILVDADGNEIQRWFGIVPEETLRGAFDDYLATASR